MKCSFTVCIGSSRLIEDDLGMADDWYQRINNNLKQAKKNGPNEICFGISMNNVKDSLESKVDEVTIDDKIKIKSLEQIDVCCRFMVCYFSLCWLLLKKQKKLGLVTAIKLKDIKIVANNGELVNENNSDMKMDYDPTQTSLMNGIIQLCT